MGFKIRHTRIKKPSFWVIMCVWPWANCLPGLHLKFATYKTKISVISEAVESNKQDNSLLYESVKVLVTQSCPTLCNPTDRSPPGSSVHGISQAGVYSVLPLPSSGDLPDPGIKPKSPTPVTRETWNPVSCHKMCIRVANTITKLNDGEEMIKMEFS